MSVWQRVAARQPHWLVGVIVLILLAGIGFWNWRATRPVELRIGLFAGSNWNVPEGDSYAVVDEAIQHFEETHPGVKVTYGSGIKKEDYSEWLAEQMLGGTEPDVFVIPGEDFNLYAGMGALTDLTAMAHQDRDFDWSVYYPAALAYGSYEGHSYGLPVGSVPTLMFVNKTLLAREGIPVPSNDWTWDDMLSICRQVTKDQDGDGVLDQFGVYDYGWRQAAVANGVKLFSEDGKTSYFADQRMEEVVRFMLDLHDVQRGHEVTAKDFDMGRVAFRPFTFAEYRTYKPYPWLIKKYSSFEWDCIRMPAGPSGRNVSTLQTMLLGISARTDHPELAWELLREICYAPEIQQVMLTKSQGLPARRDVVESDAAQQLFMETTPGSDGMNLKTVSEVMADGVTAPKFKGYNEVMILADNELNKIITGDSSINNALNRLQKSINMYLQQ